MTVPASLIGLSPAELAASLESAGLDAKAAQMRARQLWNWVYVHGRRDFMAMTNLAKDFRTRAADTLSLARPEVVTQQISEDGTRKWLLRTAPGIEFETVYIPEEDRGTLCVSSQVGCTLTCRFCHTGTQKLVRNLTPFEIVGQLMVARDALEDWPSTKENRRITNVVMMGMGEPLYNFDNVKAALRDRCRRRRPRPLQAPHHALDRGRRADDRARRQRDRLLARRVAARCPRRGARCHRAAEQEISDRGIDGGLPHLSRRVERAAHHLRIRDAERRQRYRSPTPARS